MPVAEPARGRPSPWTIGLLVAFGIMLAANAALIYLALDGEPELLESYTREKR